MVALLDSPHSHRAPRLPRMRREIARPRARSAAGRRNLNLLPVDRDVIHPATGEMSESRESSEGGYVAIRRDEGTPVTKLKLHKLDGIADAQFKLVFNSSKIRLWKQLSDGVLSEAVTTDSTTFSADQDTEIYVEGVAKSDIAKDIEVGLKILIGPTASSVVPIKLTVVHAEFDVFVRTFIPYDWVRIPHPLHQLDVAKGDNRDYDPLLAGEFRTQQAAVVIPFEALRPRAALTLALGYWIPPLRGLS